MLSDPPEVVRFWRIQNGYNNIFGESKPQLERDHGDLKRISKGESLYCISAKSIPVWTPNPHSSCTWAWLIGEWTCVLLIWTWAILSLWASFWGWVRLKFHICKCIRVRAPSLFGRSVHALVEPNREGELQSRLESHINWEWLVVWFVCMNVDSPSFAS